MKWISILFILFWITNNCILHSVSIDEKTGIPEKKSPQIPKSNTIPLKVQFGETKRNEFVVLFGEYRDEIRLPRESYDGGEYKLEDSYKMIEPVWEIPCNKKLFEESGMTIVGYKREIRKDAYAYFRCEVGKYVKSNLFSDEYFSKFQRSAYLQLDANSNLKIVIDSSLGSNYHSSLWDVFAGLSFQLFPFKVSSSSDVQFGIWDTEKNVLLKNYTYTIDHRMYHGIPIPLVGTILPIFSDRYDHSQNLNTFAIARVVYNQFEEDFLNDFYTDPNLQKAAYLLPPSIYKIQGANNTEISKNPKLPFLMGKLESKLLQHGVEIKNPKDDSKIDKIIQIDSMQIKENTFEFQFSCLEIKTKNLLWSEIIPIPFSKEEKNPIISESEMEKAVDELIERLVGRREIN